MSTTDFLTFNSEFVSAYNKGLPVIKRFKGGDCCIATAGGKMLTIGGSHKYASKGGDAATCKPAGGYSGKLKFWKSRKMTTGHVFGAKTTKECKLNHNPAVFIRASTTGTKFKLFDVAKAPSGGWRLLSATHLNAHKKEFVNYYNANGGLNVAKAFPSGNCCIAVKGGKMLVIKGSATGYQFPASTTKDGGQQMRCNPKDGYRTKYSLFGSQTLKHNVHFTAASGCKLDHNPAVYALFPTHIKRQDSDDCVVSEWSDWSACGVSCPSKDNAGLRVRDREVVQKRKNGGKRCPVLKETRSCTGRNTCCSATTCGKTTGRSLVQVSHANKERNGRHHICEMGLFKLGKCDCECGILGVTIHSRRGHAPCMVWGSFKDCDRHRGSQDWLHNRVPRQGVLKVEAEYGYLSHMQREPMPFMPRQRINGEFEKTSTHMYVRSTSTEEGFVEWQVFAEATGSYHFAAHYSNPTGATAAALVVTTAGNYLKGASRKAKEMKFKPTLAGKFQFATAYLKLNKGVSTVRMRSVKGASFPQVDFFRIADLGTSFDLAKIDDMDRSAARHASTVLKVV
jgi:hypothetical protein